MTTNNGAPIPASSTIRVALVTTGMIQITLGAGLVVGWAGIAGSVLTALRQEGGAGLTLDETTQLYGMAAACNYISPLFLGALLDSRGPRTASFVSNAIVAVGCFLFGRAIRFQEFAFAIGLVAFGGPGVQTSVIHTANLFPAKRYFVMGLVGECITLSFAIFPIMDVFWETYPKTCDFETLFLTQAILVGLSAVVSLFIWPDSPYEHVHVQDEQETEDGNGESEKLVEGAAATALDEIQTFPLNEESFIKQVTSGPYIRLSIFFLVTSFYANLYIATVTTEFGDTQQFTFEKQHEMARLLSFIDAGAILIAPLSGYLLDSVGFGAAALVAIGLGMLQMILLLVAQSDHFDSSFDSPDFPIIMALMIASFVCYAAFRAFLFPYYFANLSQKLGFRFFGILSGLSFGSSGFCQLLIAPISAAVDGECHNIMDSTFEEYQGESCAHGRWTMLHLIQLGSFFLLLVIPWMDRKSSGASSEQKQMPTDTEYGSIDGSHGGEPATLAKVY